MPGRAPEPTDSPEPSRRRPPRPLVRLLVLLSSSTAVLAVAAVTAAAAIVPPIGARRAARDAARRELAGLLAAGEPIVATAFVSQRRWLDMWREAFGVVAVTDRRLLYVGAPPTPLLRPREDGPPDLVVETYAHDAAFTLEAGPVGRRARRGLRLRTPTRAADFLVDDASWPSALAVAEAAAQARRRVADELARLAAADVAPPPAPDVYVPHTVRRGETLTGLARRYGTTPEVLRQLNQLSDDRIQVGQRLRVPRMLVADTTPP